jgi:hypothetical protein
MSDDPIDWFRNLPADGAAGDSIQDMFDRNGMTVERYDQLMNNPELPLTDGEVRVGWYWSPSWDGMLVHKSWPEAKFEYPDETLESA